MLVDFSRLLYLTVLELLRRAWAALPVHLPLTAAVLAFPGRLEELHCAWKMEAMARRMQATGRRISLVHGELRRGGDAAIRSDMNFRVMLAGLKEDMRALQRETVAWQRDRAAVPGVRLGSAIAEVAEVSEALYVAADDLLQALIAGGLAMRA